MVSGNVPRCTILYRHKDLEKTLRQAWGYDASHVESRHVSHIYAEKPDITHCLGGVTDRRGYVSQSGYPSSVL
jgi:hypothetical protein